MAVIGTNLAAVSASNYLTINNENLTQSIQKLASGSRIANPVDDAAGTAVSGNLDARIARLDAAVNGAQDVVSYGQTVDGFLSTLQSMTSRLSELAQELTNGSFSCTDRLNYQTEANVLVSQFTQIVSNANFNGSSLFSGSSTSNIRIAIDASGNTDQFGVTNSTAVMNIVTGMLTNIGSLSVTDVTNAICAIGYVTSALTCITTLRAKVNADISKFNFYISNIRTESVNVQAANSRIKDLNIAEESTNESKQNILVQAATSMLAQANTSQQNILQLLR